MHLSSLSKSIICMAIALNLGACASVLPSRSSILGGALAEKGDTRPFETPLPVNTAHKKLAIGGSATVGVKEDGTVWSWGGGTHGDLGDGITSSYRNTPKQIQGMTDFIEVAGNGAHFLALRRDGTVWSWGDNEYGQLGYKTDKWFSSVPQQIVGLKNIISVAAGGKYSLALDKMGTVYISGVNERWGVNVNKTAMELINTLPVTVIKQADAVKIVTRGVDAVMMAQDGQIWFCCEKQSEGLRLKNFPQKVVDIALSSGEAYYLLPTGLIMAEGQNISGELGQGDYKSYASLVQVKGIGRIKSIAANVSSGLALDEKGRIWQWGYNVRYRMIAGVQGNTEALPILVRTFPSAVSIQGGSSDAVLLDNGQVYFWGWNRSGGRGTGKAPPDIQMSSKDWFVPEKSLWTWK